MDLDDFDVLDGPGKVPSQTSKFSPKSSKFKPQQSEPLSSKPESRNSGSIPQLQESLLASKPEPQNAPLSKKNEEEEEIKARIIATPKTEHSALNNGAVKIEIDSKAEVEAVKNLGDPMDEDKQEEDMFVREIDVFFTLSMDSDTQLYVMQYLLRPCWRPYELDERCEEVRVKPQSTEVQLDLSIDDSSNWDHAQASKFNLKKQTLSSSFMPPCASGYAVGVPTGNKLFLNPIHAVVQLRSSVEHVDSVDSKRKSNATSNTGAAIKSEDPNEGKSIGSSKKQETGVLLEVFKSWLSAILY